MADKILQNGFCKTSELNQFYDGKTVFLTGASGFLGQVILEILLRCCPGIIRIYILLRPKKGLRPEDRKKKIFKTELFHNLIEDNPGVLKKVVAVPGDVPLDNLGMCEMDYQKISEEVSIVFHVAASISFFRPISFLMHQNVVGMDNIIDLCKKLNKLKALVYTSTLYSNSNRSKNEIEEIVYKLPFKAEEAVRLARNGNVEALNHLFSQCNPNFVNYYTFSKCVSENLLAEKAHDLPVSIIRPSIIISCMKGALPGYAVDGSAIVNIAIWIAKGFVRVARVYGKNKVEFIPADIAANTHIVAAYLQSTKSIASPRVYNCTSAVKEHTWEEFLTSILSICTTYPFPNSYIKPNTIFCSNPTMYKFYFFTYHFIPAIIMDAIFWISRREMKFLKLCKFQERITSITQPILNRRWDFRCENFVSLSEKLNETDAEIFYVDMREFDMKKWALSLYTGSPYYRVNGKPYKDTLAASILRNFLTYLLKCIQIGCIAALCYFFLRLNQVFMHMIS